VRSAVRHAENRFARLRTTRVPSHMAWIVDPKSCIASRKKEKGLGPRKSASRRVPPKEKIHAKANPVLLRYRTKHDILEKIWKKKGKA